MIDIEKLSQDLAALEDADWYRVWEDAKDKRRKDHERKFPYEEPGPDMTRDQFARWIAFRHLASDSYIREVFFLPHGAPANEIRLLEVNIAISMPEELKASAEDFTYDIDHAPFQVFVADVTPRQWERIQMDQSLLPDEWSLVDRQVFGR